MMISPHRALTPRLVFIVVSVGRMVEMMISPHRALTPHPDGYIKPLSHRRNDD